MALASRSSATQTQSLTYAHSERATVKNHSTKCFTTDTHSALLAADMEKVCSFYALSPEYTICGRYK